MSESSRILLHNPLLITLSVCAFVEVLILGFRTSTDRTSRSLPFVSGGRPRVNTRVLFFFFFFFFRPFSTGSLCMTELTSVYFKWHCPGLIPGFFFLLLFFPVTEGRGCALVY
jgi:hypothetical protein